MIRKIIYLILIIVVIVFVLTFNKPISIYLANLLDNQNNGVVPTSNNYKRNYNFKYIKSIDDYTPYSYNSLLNVIYSILNNGWDSFSFYCPNEYVNCVNDIKTITKNNEILTHINNFVHPYNSFSNIITSVSSSGEIILDIEKVYSKSQINEIDAKMKEILKNEVDESDVIEDKLKSIHDYIINNTIYDTEAVDNNSNYLSNTAYGSLIQGHAICSGYADAMALFLNYYNLSNYKISSDTHVWNAVKINDTWYHLDVTWDDQIDYLGNERLIHKFFLINSNNLKKYAETDHEFDNTIYQEYRYN